ncbi:preprotein translocase subunit SecG [Candidatus Omnitrophota bacterium]
MYGLILAAHVLVAILLIVVILIQRGRGGGLVESFSGVESMFGTRTSQFLTRATAIFATVFLFTSITLALLAAGQGRSLIGQEDISSVQGESPSAVMPDEPAATQEAELPAQDAGSLVGQAAEEAKPAQPAVEPEPPVGQQSPAVENEVQ